MRFNSMNIRPRYSGGSPGWLNEDRVIHEARHEIREHAAAIEGIYGPEQKARAEKLGLSRIAYALWEHKSGWHVHDMITGEVYDIPAEKKLRKLGYVTWFDLPQWAKDLTPKPEQGGRELTAPQGVFQAWYKVEYPITQWEPEIIEVRKDWEDEIFREMKAS